jgi:ATP-dependent Clp protease ATP-binding subunit ClpC
MTDTPIIQGRFTEPAIRALQAAWEASVSLDHDYIGTEHLLLALVQTPGTAGEVLRAHGVEPARARAEVVRLLADYLPSHGTPGQAANRPKVPAKDALSSLGIDLAEIQRRADETFGPGALQYPSPPTNFATMTDRARMVVMSSFVQARETGKQQVGPEHLLLGLLEFRSGLAPAVLTAMGTDTEALRQSVLQRLA